MMFQNLIICLGLIIIASCNNKEFCLLENSSGKSNVCYYHYSEDLDKNFTIFRLCDSLHFKELSPSYIRVRNFGMVGWQAIVEWRNDSVVLLVHEALYFEQMGESNSRFVLEQIDDQSFFNLYYNGPIPSRIPLNMESLDSCKCISE